MIIDPKINTKTICRNDKHSDLGESVSQQTIDYADAQNDFQIIFDPGNDPLNVVPAKEVRIYDVQNKLIAKLKNECVLDFKSATYTCTISNDNVPSSLQGKQYNVKVVNLCEQEEDTNITLLVRNSNQIEPNESSDIEESDDPSNSIESGETVKDSNSFYISSRNLIGILVILSM